MNGLLRTMLRGAMGVAVCVALVACGGSSGEIPVVSKEPYREIPEESEVQAGDSIYSVAWRFGLDPEKIAEWNDIAKPYRVHSGQRLRLRAPAAAAQQNEEAVTPLPATELQTQTLRSTAAVLPVTPAVQTSVPVQAPRPQAPASAPPTPPNEVAVDWRWPAEGELVAGFSQADGIRGIQIAGASGTAIRATADGEVVYAGDGLRGYGYLVIIKHSEEYLSAYAHNRAILVGEGDGVQSGQQIAEMGDSGTDRTMLHFEIRQNGEPVDPLGFLSER